MRERDKTKEQLKGVFSHIRKEWTLERQRRINTYRRLVLSARETLKSTAQKEDLSHQDILNLMRVWTKSFREQIEKERDQPTYPKWLDQIARNISELPEEIQLPQSEKRFQAHEEDRIWQKAIKLLKRLGRGISRLPTHVKNGWKRFMGIEPIPIQPWTQRIPLRYIAMDSVLSSKAKWNNEIYHDWYVITRFLRDLEHWQDSWLSGKELRFSGNEHIYDRISDVHESLTKLEKLIDDQIDSLQHLQQHVASSVAQQVEEWHQRSEHHMEVAGTLEHRISYARENIVELRKQRENQLRRSEQNWIDICDNLLDEIGLYQELLQYGYRVDHQTEQVIKYITDQIRKRWVKPVEVGLTDVVEVYRRIQASEEPQAWEQEKVQLLGLMDNQWLQALQEDPIAEKIIQRLNQYQADIQLSIRSMPEESVVFNELKLDQEEPTYKVSKVPLREWATRLIKQMLVQRLESLPESWKQFEETLRAEGADIREIISVNMESAIEGEQAEIVSDPEGQTMLLEGLERALTKLEQLRGDVEYERQRAEYVLLGSSTEAVWNMLEWIGTDRVEEFKRSDRSSQVKEVASDWKTRLKARSARVSDRLSIWTRWSWQKLKKTSQYIAPWLGFKLESKKVGEKRKLDITAYLSETDEKINQLPYVYRKIFSLEATDEPRFYVSQGDLLSRFEKSYQNWLNGRSTNAAIVGERGSGKTTLIQVVKSRFLNENNLVVLNLNQTIWQPSQIIPHIAQLLDLPATTDINELAEAIRTRADKTKNVIIVEGLQNTYLRHIDGYEGARMLLLLISKTRQSIFWITSCSRYAWYFLSKAVSIDDYFSVILETDKLKEEQIQQLILDRHKVSGYDLWFEPTDTIKNSRAFRKVMDNQEQVQSYLRSQFFEKLSQISEGNASIAMLFWLRSIRKIEETRLVLSPIEVTQLEAIDEMKPETLFALAAMIFHDALNPEELALSQHIQSDKAEMIMGRLATLGLLNKVDTEEKQYWAINPLVYRQIIRALRQRNIIHG